MLLHNIDKKNYTILEEIFAFLTEEGWIIPEWLKSLETS